MLPLLHMHMHTPTIMRVACQFDRKWERDPGFVFYDFNSPEAVLAAAPALARSFDMVVIDPPFITHEVCSCVTVSLFLSLFIMMVVVLVMMPQVWERYAAMTSLLLKEGRRERNERATDANADM